jgi:ribokinase
MDAPRICVVGSANLDLNTYVERFPAPGETLHGRRFTTGHGGKGANQAVMAARLGGAVTLIARIGSDMIGRDMIEHFQHEGIDTRHITSTDGVSTGAAVITVDATGRNTIIVTPGANGMLTAVDVEAARPAIEAAGVLVCQQEVPAEANLAAMRIANRAGVPVIFNPAPVGDGMPGEAYALATVLCPNEHEASLLMGFSWDRGQPRRSSSRGQGCRGSPPPSLSAGGARAVPGPRIPETETAARELLARGSQSVVLTLGERGCLVVTASEVTALPAPAVEAVDTTGAGDAFIGSLAFFLARGEKLTEAARRANRIAAISVQFVGTQTSFPHAAELAGEILGERPA